jgi:hypothetical protein
MIRLMGGRRRDSSLVVRRWRTVRGVIALRIPEGIVLLRRLPVALVLIANMT